MYDLIPFYLETMILISGLVIVINPKGSTKKEARNDANAVAKVKKIGFLVIACGVVELIIGIIKFIK